MKITATSLIIGIAIAATGQQALAASDYYLKFDGVEDESSVSAPIMSWSLGASNPTVAGEAAKGGGASVGKANPGRIRNSLPPGNADLAVIAAQDVVEGFSLAFDPASPALAKMCASGTHIKNAQIVGRGATYDLTISSMTGCPASDSERISMNVTVPKQTQGATFGEKVNAGLHAAGSIVVQFTGQMKHQKTGHVTLMK